MYQYNATVTRVVDGDTVYLSVDLGFNVEIQIDVRLAHINAPEMSTADGKAAKLALQGMLPVDARLTLDCTGKDKYGRWLGVLTLPSQTKTVNQAMLDNGFAKPYEGGART